MQEIKGIQSLRNEINKEENRRKQVYMAWLCLDFVKRNPEYFIEIGMGWLDDNHFLFNSTIFGLFSDRKLNTINHYFKTYDFGMQKMNSMIKKSACDIYSINSFVDQKSWCIRWCNGFTQSTTLEEAKNWKTIKAMKKDKSNKPKKASKKKLINERLINFSKIYPPIEYQLNWLSECRSYSEENSNAPQIGTLTYNNIECISAKTVGGENDSSNIKNDSNLSDNSINLANSNPLKDDNPKVMDDSEYHNSFDLIDSIYDDNLSLWDSYFFHEYDDDHIDDFFNTYSESIESNNQMMFHFY